MDPLALPALHASHGGCWLKTGAADTRAIGKGEAIVTAADTPLLMLGAPLVANRLGYPDLSGLDLLELFAFVHPARFMVPTPKGWPMRWACPSRKAMAMCPAAATGRRRAAGPVPRARWAEREGAWTVLDSLARLRWPWAPLLAQAVERPQRAERWLFPACPNGKRCPNAPSPRKCG
jgi:ATP-dependent DNA helicase DinG